MSLSTMAKSLSLEIPNVSETLAKNKLQEAMGKIHDETDWSYQTGHSQWLCAGMVANTGTVTATPYSNKIVGDAVASAAWAAIVNRPLLTELQFRNPPYALYDIVAYDITSNPPFGTLTLDRVWGEPSQGAGLSYYIYQAYFPVPVADFKKFIDNKDTTDNDYIDFWSMSLDDLAVEDAQRMQFGPGVPTFAVPFDQDQRSGSLTPNYLRYEVWPHPLSRITYSFDYKRRGPSLINATDTVPYPLTEELLMWRAKSVLYQFKEAQKGEQIQRGSGANWQFLAEAAMVEYSGRDGTGGMLKKIRALDANLHRDFLTRRKKRSAVISDGYSTNRIGALNIGRMS